MDKALGSIPRKLRHKGQSIGGKKENWKERKVDRSGGRGCFNPSTGGGGSL